MQVTVKLFATLRFSAGWAEQHLDVDEGATVGTILQILEERYPDLDLANRTVYAALNQDYAQQDDRLKDGDIVALFPPVSGGI